LNNIKIKLNEDQSTDRPKYSDSEVNRFYDPNIDISTPEQKAAKKRAEDAANAGANYDKQAYNRMDWEAVNKAAQQSLDASIKRGDISPEAGKKKKEEVESENASRSWEQTKQKWAKTAEPVADAATQIGGISLTLTGAGAPAGMAILGGHALSKVERAALTDDPEKRSDYLKQAAWDAGLGVAAPLAIGKAINVARSSQVAAEVANAAKAARTSRAATAAEKVAERIPGASKVAKVAREVYSSKGNDAGGIMGGMVGMSTITPEDNMLTASAKVIGGTIAGRKGAGWLASKLPKLGQPLVAGERARRAYTLAKEIEAAAEKGPMSLGHSEMLPRAGKDFPKGSEAPEPLKVPSNTAVGRWQPNPDTFRGGAITRKGTAVQDYGYPQYPEQFHRTYGEAPGEGIVYSGDPRYGGKAVGTTTATSSWDPSKEPWRQENISWSTVDKQRNANSQWLKTKEAEIKANPTPPIPVQKSPTPNTSGEIVPSAEFSAKEARRLSVSDSQRRLEIERQAAEAVRKRLDLQDVINSALNKAGTGKK
jgi:hypothetical protein